VVRQPGLLCRAATGGAGVIAAGVLTLALLYFMLATGDLFMEKTIRVLPRLRDKVRALSIARTVEAEISRYLFTVTAINICLGAAIAAGMALVGLPNPVLWGVLGARLNFIPSIGSLIGVAVVFAVAVVTFNAPLDILAPPRIYFGLTALEGQFLTPTVIGRRLEMNPVAIFLGVAFWAWLWGVAGAVLAVPILLVIKITADHVDNLAPLSEFLSDRRGIGARDRQAARDQS
ncbi:MAG: AI-2E family transporter, partial [Alphaproteobacteria bacterium]